MRIICSLCILLMNAQLAFSNSFICPDPPINDDPCFESSNPPLDLTGGGSHVGTTCCARGPQDENPDGTIADFENVDCSAATEDAAVWYIYTPDPSDDGYQVILEAGGPDPSEGPIAIEIYKGPIDQGCNGGFGETVASSCADFGVDFNIGNCFAPDDVLFIKISTDDAIENCGTYVLTVIPASCGDMADNCIDLADQEPIYPITNPSFSIDYLCIEGCLDFACPEDDALGGCPDFTEMPTVWFQIIADDIAAQMFTTVEPHGNWDPIWSIYSGPDCDNLTIINYGGTPPCSNGDNTPELQQTSVFDSEENYWIAISVDPSSLPSSGLDNGSFELCVSTTLNALICMGEEEGECDDESLVMEIIDREFDQLPLEGPFVQGEEVTINISFFYDASESGSDWLAGFIPKFGPGWDLQNFDYSGNAPVGNGQTAQWYAEDGDCAPILQEPNPILCIYTDADGNLQLCNMLCSPCSECPQQGIAQGDPLPSGYFWVSDGINPGCDNDCSPGEGWGIGSFHAQIDWTFTLNVKVFEDFETCFENDDLSISFQTFSHGSLGCWEDPYGECLLDRTMFSPAWEVECDTPPAVVGEGQELCHDGVVSILLQTVDGSTTTIVVEVEDNPFVDGESEHEFLGGSGTIDDQLINMSNDVQIVVYKAYTVDPSLISPGPINTIEVTVYPELQASFPPYYVCEGDCTELFVDIVGGKGAPYTYFWSDGQDSEWITVCPSVPTTYFVTIEDALGCFDVSEVIVDVKPTVEVSLPESIQVVKDNDFDPFDPEFLVCVDIAIGTGPYNVIWNPQPGLVGLPFGAFGECFAINEELSSGNQGDNGQYYLKASVTDFFGCTNVDSMLVTILSDSIEESENKLIYDFFIDEDGDGIRDSLENSFAEGAFFLEPEQTIYYNTTLGEDTLILDEGAYTLSYIPATTDVWVLTTDSIVDIVLDSMNMCVKVEFGLKPIELISNVELTHFLVRRCNTNQNFYVAAENNGTKTESGILWAELDDELIRDELMTSSMIDTFIAPNMVGWIFEDLLPGNTIIKSVQVYIPGPPDLPVGWVLSHSIYSELAQDDGTTEISDKQEFSGNIQCGYDPNDKAVEPEHEEGYTNIDENELIFKIRFQNTGNAPAYNIQIRDTLSEHLDISTVRYIAGSHDDLLTMSRVNDRILIFTFNNIFLPDSTTDYEGSQGFFLYRVALNEDLPEGTLIENTAHIYFDNNPAVVTNTTKNILYPDLDNDGYYSVEDCNDEDVNINPGVQEIPNNDIDEDCDGVVLVIDNDMDGFNSDEDCDDDDPNVNPDAEEIINNNVDENCDDLVVIIDSDGDGFNSDEDCDDENADINPDAEEVVNNDVDEDCDGEAVIIDVDGDGFNSDEDCDDENADINPDAEEVVNNEVDEDCDGEALMIDVDGDGFNSDEDCDDENADINPNAEEIVNNEVDEDCDGEALIIDNDEDGFNSDVDCDDDNADINPDAEDIPDNGIDEDCDGEDTIIISVSEEALKNISINPNPSNDMFNISLGFDEAVNYVIRDVVGREVDRGKISPSNKTIYLGDEPNGLYLIVFSHPELRYSSYFKLLKI